MKTFPKITGRKTNVCFRKIPVILGNILLSEAYKGKETVFGIKDKTEEILLYFGKH